MVKCFVDSHINSCNNQNNNNNIHHKGTKPIILEDQNLETNINISIIALTVNSIHHDQWCLVSVGALTSCELI